MNFRPLTGLNFYSLFPSVISVNSPFSSSSFLLTLFIVLLWLMTTVFCQPFVSVSLISILLLYSCSFSVTYSWLLLHGFVLFPCRTVHCFIVPSQSARSHILTQVKGIKAARMTRASHLTPSRLSDRCGRWTCTWTGILTHIHLYRLWSGCNLKRNWKTMIFYFFFFYLY